MTIQPKGWRRFKSLFFYAVEPGNQPPENPGRLKFVQSVKPARLPCLMQKESEKAASFGGADLIHRAADRWEIRKGFAQSPGYSP
jgi:hypothetical protein